MLRSCTQMERLIRNFADLSEIESDAVTLRLGNHDAGEMAELAAAAMTEAARARSVILEVRKADPPVTMTCDRERMLRAIGHVVENAVKVAPEGSTVTVSVALHGEDVCFAVTDRGAGLSPQVRKNLYDRHWHAKRANRVGAGFGLAIARGFLTAHGGRLAVESRHGSETTFTLCAPKAGPTSS
jgi:signal transduction histidine kinase